MPTNRCRCIRCYPAFHAEGDCTSSCERCIAPPSVSASWVWFDWCGAIIAERRSELGELAGDAWHCIDFPDGTHVHMHVAGEHTPETTVVAPEPYSLAPTTLVHPGPAPAVRCDGCEAHCDECENHEGECECVSCRCGAQSPDLELCASCEECLSDCCECRECQTCETRGDISICSECDRCTDGECCDCWSCDACGDTFRQGGRRGRCSECGECDNCCGCASNDEEDDGGNGSRPYNLFVERDVRFYPPARGLSQVRRNPSRRLVAVEIEVSGSDTHGAVKQACHEWECSIVSDGSLPSGGYEINTSPAGGDRFCDEIDALSTALLTDRARVTKECGLHVHVDARDFSYYEIRRLVMLYAQLEKALFLTQPQSRRKNTYCTPCGPNLVRGLLGARAPKANKDALLGNVYGGTDTRDYRKQKYHEARYSALNLHSWLYRGTVECRLHTGSVSADKIIPWGMLWAAMLDYAARMSERNLARLGIAGDVTAQQNYLLDNVAPNDEVRDYLRKRWLEFHGVCPQPVVVAA